LRCLHNMICGSVAALLWLLKLTCGRYDLVVGRFPDSIDNCQKGSSRKKGVSAIARKTTARLNSKTTGWRLADDRKSITFTDKKGIGKLKLKGTRDLHFYQRSQIKRVRLVKRADGYYVQFCIQVDRSEKLEITGNAIGIRRGTKRVLHRLPMVLQSKIRDLSASPSAG
jgi:hypothetical protein